MQILSGHIGSVATLSFCSDGTHLVSAGGKADRVALWNLIRNSRVNLRSDRQPIESLTCARRGPALLVRRYRQITLWADPVHHSAPVATRAAYRAAFRADGTEVVFNPVENQPTAVHFLDAADGSPTREPLPLALHIYHRAWSGLAWSPDSQLLAVLHYDSGGHRIDLFRVFDGRSVGGPLRPERGYPLGLAFSPDGRTIAAVGTGSVGVQRWDVASGEPLPALVGHTQPVVGFDYLPDGRLLSGDHKGEVRLWDARDDHCQTVHDWRVGDLTALAVAPDGMRAAVGSATGTILLWDID